MISDRAQRRAILGSTAALPQALRVPAREALLGRWEFRRALRSRIFVIGHPKSGNTWLRTMISRAYHVRHGLPESLVLKSDELHLANPAIPRFLVTNGLYSYEGVIGRALSADAPDTQFDDRRVTLLTRHPADIAVSWYLQFTKRISPAKREMINYRLARPIDPDAVSMWEFVQNEEIGLPSLIRFLNTWERNVRRLEHSLIVRYEELRTETRTTLERITDFMGLGLTDHELDEAVAFGSFDNLRKLEGQGFFPRGGLSLRNAADPNARKVRRAKIHGYRDDLSPEQIEWVDRLVAAELSPTLGYSTPDTAPGPLRASSGAEGVTRPCRTPRSQRTPPPRRRARSPGCRASGCCSARVPAETARCARSPKPSAGPSRRSSSSSASSGVFRGSSSARRGRRSTWSVRMRWRRPGRTS